MLPSKVEKLTVKWFQELKKYTPLDIMAVMRGAISEAATIIDGEWAEAAEVAKNEKEKLEERLAKIKDICQ